MNDEATEFVRNFPMPVGLPRPVVDNKPVPWTAQAWGNADGEIDRVEWRDSDPTRRDQVRYDHKCGVCGEIVGDDCAVIARIGDRAATDRMIMHPRCGMLALARCPHFTRHELLVGGRDGLYWGSDGHLMMKIEPALIEIARREGPKITKLVTADRDQLHLAV